MGSITKRVKGYRAQISVKGMRETATFPTKAEAASWINERELALRKQSITGINATKTCSDAFKRYLEEVSVHKRGFRWEEIRLQAMEKHQIGKLTLGNIKLCEVTSDTLGQWRDMRLLTISGSSVNRELNLLAHVFTVARREWKWIVANPATDVRRPKDPPPRDRRISDDEIKRICYALGYDGQASTKTAAVAVAFLFAIETAMRAGEICGLTWENVDDNVAHLPKTKNGLRRDVPLTPKAVELLGTLPKVHDTCFGLSPASLDALFRKAKSRALITDLTFHDTRHEAITRLAKKLGVLDLARMVGHRDLRMLQIYYNETAKEIADKFI